MVLNLVLPSLFAIQRTIMARLVFKGREYTKVEFKETVPYSWVRHAIMLGFIIAFWATPDMTRGHLLFAAVTTAYILVGIQVEECTLLALHGENYRRNRGACLDDRPHAAKGCAVVAMSGVMVGDPYAEVGPLRD